MIAGPLFEEPDGGGAAAVARAKDAAYWEARRRRPSPRATSAKRREQEAAGVRASSHPEQKARLAELEDAAAEGRRGPAEEGRRVRVAEEETCSTSTSRSSERDTKLTTLSQRFQNTVVRAEFGTATDSSAAPTRRPSSTSRWRSPCSASTSLRVVDDERGPPRLPHRREERQGDDHPRTPGATRCRSPGAGRSDQHVAGTRITFSVEAERPGAELAAGQDGRTAADRLPQPDAEQMQDPKIIARKPSGARRPLAAS
jgi:hypothetical protein